MSAAPARPFGTLLVANRGEIAVRVIGSARVAGLRTVAVWSDADQDAPHVAAADQAVRIGPTPAAESYLSIEALLRACAETGAEAVHPGYGFLSERADFAQAVTDAGLVFVGPAATVIEQMGRKDRARAIAEKAGVPVVPAHRLDGTDASYPLLVKAAAGGGGKGMRIVRSPAELSPALVAAGREAGSAFGDDALLVERFVERGRHVEVQVVADTFGTVLHLGERDCSVQRRHQKVLEEAPAPTISTDLRERLCSAAVALAAEVGYTGAGTVEFLVAGDEFFFLEMNTRLQVEHPVTEAVTGLDLVRLQLEVAAGRPLGLTQGDVRIVGHAIEARVYAEDPYAGFLPQAGRATHVQWPDAVRVDAALESGQAVPTSYDPLLGKVIAHGASRESARRGLVTALSRTTIVGLTTNVGFLHDLVATDAFAAAAIHTDWLDNDPASAEATQRPAVSERVWQTAARAVAGDRSPTDRDDPFGVGDGWRLGGPPARAPVPLSYRGERRVVHVAPSSVRAPAGQRREWIDAHHVTVVHNGHAFVFDRADAFAAEAMAASADGEVVAPMPGTVLNVQVAPGEQVAANQPLGVLEAMKMELTLVAPLAGKVLRVDAEVGTQVPIGHVLFSVQPPG